MIRSLRLKAWLLLTIIMLNVVLLPVQTLAITDPLFYSRNDILMYNDECVASGDGQSVILAGKDNLEKILNFFMRKGLNLAQASGIVGNMMQESGLKPNVEQGGRLVDESYTPINGTGFGLVQWTFSSRQVPLKQTTDAMGVPVTNLGGQLAFVWKELNGNYLSTLNQLRATNDPVEAAVIVHDGYEVSADSDAMVRSVRGGNAKGVYDKYKNADPLAGASADTAMTNPGGFTQTSQSADTSNAHRGCTEDSFAGGNFTETLKAYAWLTYKGNTLDMQPAYVDAVAKARAEGLYVGDGQGAWGVDCGVFVTLLVRDSGFDPGYNYNGRGGNTTQQYKWTSENWETLGDASTIDPARLQPGDVANNESTHTFIYVGDVPGFEAKIASSSWGERAPMADPLQSPTQSGYTWFRKKATAANSGDITNKL